MEKILTLHPAFGDDANAALVPLLILNFGWIRTLITVALAAGPMVMINSATGFRRVDHDKIALARSYGATTFQIFTKIRIPMAMPMIIVGLMMGAIFSVITAIGAEMSGGGFGLGSKLTTFSSTLRTAEFFAVILILTVMGIIYVFFSWLGKKLAGWESWGDGLRGQQAAIEQVGIVEKRHDTLISQTGLSRRKFLKVSSAGVVTATGLGGK